MSLKAGRVGVHPADVDPINGHISPDATGAYTKAQADEKFLTKSDGLSKTDAASTYETISNAAIQYAKIPAVGDPSKLFIDSVNGVAAEDPIKIKLPAIGANAQTFVGILWINRVQYTLNINYNGTVKTTNYSDATAGALTYDNSTYELVLTPSGTGSTMGVIGMRL